MNQQHQDLHPGEAIQVADPEERLLTLWLNGRSPHTQKTYRRHIKLFRESCSKPLNLVTAVDVQDWHMSLGHLAPESQNLALAAVKSLLSFAYRTGLIPTNVGPALRLVKTEDTLAERILTEEEVEVMIEGEETPRNQLILKVLYYGGLRASELCQLKWRDLKLTNVVKVFGKGRKTRSIRLKPELYREVMQLKGDKPQDAPVFVSAKGGHLDTSQIRRIVAAAGRRSGIEGNVSPHWLRHSHASHSLDKGAPVHLVQQTLGHSSLVTTSRYLHAKPKESSSLYL